MNGETPDKKNSLTCKKTDKTIQSLTRVLTKLNQEKQEKVDGTI